MKLTQSILKEEFKRLWQSLPEDSFLNNLVAYTNANGYKVSFTFGSYSDLTVTVEEDKTNV